MALARNSLEAWPCVAFCQDYAGEAIAGNKPVLLSFFFFCLRKSGSPINAKIHISQIYFN